MYFYKNYLNYLLIFFLGMFFTSCHVENISTEDNFSIKLKLKAFQRCQNDSIPLSNVKVLAINADNNKQDLLDSGTTDNKGETELTFPIPLVGQPIRIDSYFFTFDKDEISLSSTPIVVCNDMYYTIIFDTCLVKGCIGIKSLTLINDTIKNCPIDPNVKFNIRMKRSDGKDPMIKSCSNVNNIVDTIYHYFEIFNNNPYNILTKFNFIKNELNSFSVQNSLGQEMIDTIISANSKLQFRVRFIPNETAINGQCFEGKLRIWSGSCECEVDLKACVSEVPEVSVNYCLVAYNQKTLRVPDGDRDIFLIERGQTISLYKAYQPNQPPDIPAPSDGDIYVVTKNNVMPPISGVNLPTLVFNRGKVYTSIGNFLPSQFADAINMNQLLINYMKSNPQILPNNRIEDVDKNKIGNVYPFELGNYFGLLYTTSAEDGSNNPLTQQSFICFKILYPLCLK